MWVEVLEWSIYCSTLVVVGYSLILKDLLLLLIIWDVPCCWLFIVVVKVVDVAVVHSCSLLSHKHLMWLLLSVQNWQEFEVAVGCF